MPTYNPGGSTGGGLDGFSLANSTGDNNGFSWMNLFKGAGDAVGDFAGGLKNSMGDLGKWMGGDGGKGVMSLANMYMMNNAMDMQNRQMGIMEGQENRAATAQNLNTGHNLSLALQTTTPGTPEHERIKQAIANEQYTV
ncbi:MAG: hypothetical protein V3S69_07300 [Dehalococcoidales bacterium]